MIATEERIGFKSNEVKRFIGTHRKCFPDKGILILFDQNEEKDFDDFIEKMRTFSLEHAANDAEYKIIDTMLSETNEQAEAHFKKENHDTEVDGTAVEQDDLLQLHADDK